MSAEDEKIIGRLLDQGIDFERLESTVKAKDNWGALVNAFEVLTVLGVVHGVWKERQS